MITGSGAIDIIILIVSILVAMTVHEAVHAYVGYSLGDTTAMEQGRISLNPLHHIDLFATVILPIVTLLLFHAPILAAKPVPFNPERVRYGEMGAALIAAAGPLSNLVLAVVGAVVMHVVPSAAVASALLIFVGLNVALFIFNFVPIPPLDGSRVLYAFAPDVLQRLMREIEPYGLFIIIGLVVLGGFGGVLITLNQAVLNLLMW